MKILFVSCGGTIASVAGEAGTVVASEKNSEYLLDLVCKAYPSLTGSASGSVSLDPIDFISEDSTDVGAIHWKSLSARILQAYDDYDAFVVSHGTNTIAYTACALSFALGRLGKPVVLTGAQIPMGVEGSDALANLSNALRVAQLRIPKPGGGAALYSGVAVVFGSHIIPGVRAKKVTEYDIEAFKTFNASPLGRIRADEIRFDLREVSHYEQHLAPFATTAADLAVLPDFLDDVLSLTVLPDTPPRAIEHAVAAGFRAIVLRAFGAGDLPASILPGLSAAQDAGVPVVITTQCPDGTSSLELNDVGRRALEYHVIRGWDMSMEAMTTKLRWMLGQGHDYEFVRKNFGQPVRGEVSPVKRSLGHEDQDQQWWRWPRH